MHLKSLELLGFKTFADKTLLQFTDGITSVVGPNGSGKSNISDALRWVLGEQSLKDLRSSNLQEVIFNGSQARKPLGLAQVTLTIDNADNVLAVDFSEVSITRCVHRSGDSEFYINKTPCRLKDIHDLFLGTGLGRDTYSIVGQGQVDMVLSSKPEDRRLLFEEAAGISRLKYKKKEALRKLDSASQNLSRVLDIITEVESHLEPLRKQAEKAKRYIEVKSQCRILDLSFKHVQLKRLNESISSFDEKIQQQKVSLKRLKEALQNLEGEKNNLNSQQESIEQKIHETRQRLQEVASRKNHLSEELAVLRERKNSVDSNRLYLLDEISRYELKETQMAQEKENSLKRKTVYENQQNIIQQEIRKESEELRKLKDELQKEQNTLDERNKELIEVLRKLALCHNEQVFYEKLLRDRENEELTLLTEEEQVRGKQTVIANKRAQSASLLDNFKSQEKNLEFYGGECESVMVEVRQSISRIENHLHQTESNLLARQSELSIYESFVQHYTHNEVAEEIRSIVPDLGQTLFTSIRVREGYERAIEAVLGSRLECFLVQDAETAKKILLLLKEKNKGKARLYVLDLFKDALSKPPSAHLQREGVCGHALNFISFEDERFAPLMVFLLDQVFVVENIHSAFLLSSDAVSADRQADTFKNFTFVTLDGDILSPAGLYEGGSRHQESLLEIDRFRRETRQAAKTLLQEKTYRDEKLLFARRTFNALDDDFKSAQNALKETRDAKIRAEGEDISFQEQEKAVQRELEMLGVQLSACREDKQFHENQHRALEEKKHVYDNQKSFLEADIKTKDEKMTQRNVAGQDIIAKLTQKNIENVKLQEQITSILDAIKALEDLMSGIRTDFEMCELKIQESVNLLNELKTAGQEMEAQYTEIAGQEKLIEIEITQHDETRKEMLSAILEKDAQVKNLWEESALQNDVLKQFEIDLARCGLSMEEINRLLYEEYGVTKDTIPPEDIILIENEEESQDKLIRLRNSLRNIGSVNTEAEREYEEARARHEFLAAQRQDIEASVEKLKETLRELDTEARELFLKTFYEIEKHFREIFLLLFSGGDAKLILLEGDDIFDVGVDMRVQLPEKALQSISLLSGGEKSLVAIALLFAILAVNPSPFCILDEIDAALDENNVGRFAELLKEFSERTQFIVITHNKGTMKAADVLYGVTMEEPGISKLISLKFGEVREEMLAEK